MRVIRDTQAGVLCPLLCPLDVQKSGIEWRRKSADRASVSLKTGMVPDFQHAVVGLISVRSVVQLYPGPLVTPSPAANYALAGLSFQAAWVVPVRMPVGVHTLQTTASRCADSPANC